MYDPELVGPMRKELTDVGFKELQTSSEVDAELKSLHGSALVVVNSVCGCAAGAARPGVKLAIQSKVRPDKLLTVFAGQFREATERARSYFTGYAPSSPSMALFKDGELVYMMQRMDIEGRSADDIAADLKFAFQRHCLKLGAETPIESLKESFPGHFAKIEKAIGRSRGLLGEGLNPAQVKDLVGRIETLLDEEPEPQPVSFSPEGAQHFKALRAQHGTVNSGISLSEHGLDFQEKPGPDDLVYESEGIKIFVPKGMIRRFGGRRIHFEQGARGGGFAIV